MNDFSRVLKSLKAEKEKVFAMATIIRVDGSAYRREGAKMLIDEEGNYYGTISAGCLEEDLIYQAKEVIQSFEPKIVNYDLRSEDDLSWGQSAGCDGDIQIYIEPMGWGINQFDQQMLLWPYIDKQLSNGHSLVSVKCMKEGDNQGIIMLYSFDGKAMGGSLSRTTEEILSPYVQQFSNNRHKVNLLFIEELQAEYLFELYQPNDHLLIFGAGPDAEPIVELASRLDFSITVVDPRESRCNKKCFPNANNLILEHPDSYFNHFQYPLDSYVLVMTHNFNRDRKILNYLLENPPKYLGVLGPMRRTERLVEDHASLSLIHSPIGIKIGAEGPEEISVSILAEIIKLRNQSLPEKTAQRTTCWI